MGKRCNCERCQHSETEVASVTCPCGTVYQPNNNAPLCPHCWDELEEKQMARRVMIELLDFDSRPICRVELHVTAVDKLVGAIRWRGNVFVAIPITTTVVQFRRVHVRVVADDIAPTARMLADDPRMKVSFEPKHRGASRVRDG